MFEELQNLLQRSKRPMSDIATGTGLSLSILQGIKTGRKPNPTINTYTVLKEYLEQAEVEDSAEQAKAA